MEIFETSEAIRTKAAKRLGFDRPSALDLVNRGSYADDDTFLDACVKLEMERSDPEYAATRQRLVAEFQQRREAEQRQKQHEVYQQTRQNARLDDLELRNIDAEAHRRAQCDLADKRIFAHQMGETVARYAEQLTKTAKDEKASRMLFNAMLRGEI